MFEWKIGWKQEFIAIEARVYSKWQEFIILGHFSFATGLWIPHALRGQ